MRRIRKFIWAVRYRRAVREADRLSRAFGQRYMVVLLGGRLRSVPKQNIRHLIRTGRLKCTMADIESRALHITPIA